MNILDRINYFYIKKIKKYIECPVCHCRMYFNKRTISWECLECSYCISEAEFLDNYVFWFCDECGTYLNVQSGFDRNANNHICQCCGFENDTTAANIK